MGSGGLHRQTGWGWRRTSWNRTMAARDVLTKNQLCVLEKLETASGPL
ncbi:transcriptional repressor, partial [Mesorhizobium sp. BHbdii]